MSRRWDVESCSITAAFLETWPIVSAALLVALPFVGVAVSLYGMRIALTLASAIGVLILALVGVAAGIATRESWLHRIMLVLLSSGLGLLVVAVELSVRH